MGGRISQGVFEEPNFEAILVGTIRVVGDAAVSIFKKALVW